MLQKFDEVLITCQQKLKVFKVAIFPRLTCDLTTLDVDLPAKPPPASCHQISQDMERSGQDSWPELALPAQGQWWSGAPPFWSLCTRRSKLQRLDCSCTQVTLLSKLLPLSSDFRIFHQKDIHILSEKASEPLSS